MTKALFLMLLCVSFSMQGQYYNLPEQSSYSKGEISFEDYSKVAVKEMSLTADSVSFFNGSTEVMETRSLGEINYIRVQTGTKAGKYAVYGGLLMGLTSLLAIMNVQSDPTMELAPGVGFKLAGFIGGGVVLGALIGNASPQRKTYYIEDEISFIQDVQFKLITGETNLGDNFLGVNLLLTF